MDYLIPPERLETPHFTLRCYQPGDGRMLNDSATSSYEHLRPFMPWAKPDTTVEESEQYCRRQRAHWLLAENFTMGIFSPAGDRHLGGTGFHLRGEPLHLANSEIGMWIRADEAGQGLGTAVLLALLHWAFSDWPWQRLEWRCDLLNKASARTAEKAAMRLEGHFRRDSYAAGSTERRDTLVFAALRGDWVPPQLPG